MILLLKIGLVVFLLVVFAFIGWCVGASSDLVWRGDTEVDGWLIRPFKHAWCGAVYGHIYVKDTPEAGGWVGVRCKRCGKYHVRKAAVK